jgi:hypothetical protein
MNEVRRRMAARILGEERVFTRADVLTEVRTDRERVRRLVDDQLEDCRRARRRVAVEWTKVR